MSSPTIDWTSGDGLEISMPGTARPCPATVVRAGSDSLHLRLSDDDHHAQQLDVGAQVHLRRITDDGLVAADTTLAQSYEGRGTHVLVKKPSRLELLQRRALFRRPTALPITIQVCQAAREDWVSRRVYHHLTADASGSGCSLETEVPLEPGDRLKITVWPDRPQAVIAGARVVWTGPSDWPGLRRVGVVFTTISTRGQDRIVGTLMEEERVRRRIFSDDL